jgi:hypothetical protein
MTETTLEHAAASSALYCPDCWGGDPDLDANAHTLAQYLGALEGEPSAGEWLAMLTEQATPHVAQLDADGAWCWCGHSLHYPDCACDDGLACADRYRLEAYTPPSCPHGRQLEAPPAWSCPFEPSEHWPEAVAAIGPGVWLVTCGHCGGSAEVHAAGRVVAR